MMTPINIHVFINCSLTLHHCSPSRERCQMYVDRMANAATGNKTIVGLNLIRLFCIQLTGICLWSPVFEMSSKLRLRTLLSFVFTSFVFCMPHFCFIFHSFVLFFPSIKFIQMCCQFYQNLQELNDNTVNCQRRHDQNCVITRKVHAGECNSLLTTRKSTTAAQAQKAMTRPTKLLQD